MRKVLCIDLQPSVFLQVTKSLNMRNSPSAFQIRYGGCKGVVSVWPGLEDDQIHVRKSMEKFNSEHHELEMVQYTKPGNSAVNLAELLFHRFHSYLLSRLCYT